MGWKIMLEFTKIIVQYLRTVHPLRMLWHLFVLFCLLSMLSTSYILAFHFQPVMDLWQKSRSMNHFARELQDSVAVDTAANLALTQLLAASNGNRAYIFRFHNGTPSPNNVPFIFHTNTHEVIKPGTNRVINLGQRLPSSLITTMSMEFLKRKCVSLFNINARTDSSAYWYYESRAAVHLTRCAFFSKNGDLLGFVGVDYSETQTPSSVRNNEDIVRNFADQLGRIFDR
jgi:hypothetical protein